MAAIISVSSRNLTDVFILMRNNSLQNRNILSDNILDDKVALVSSKEHDISHGYSRCIDIPPAWVECIEDVQYEMNRIKNKLKELRSLHEKNLNRPSLDDTVSEEREIDNVTQEITTMFHRCQKTVHQIRERSRGSTPSEQRVSGNVVSSLVAALRELSAAFHAAQTDHLRQLRSREEKSQQFFNSAFAPEESMTDEFSFGTYNQDLDEQQQLDAASMVGEQREREVRQIVRSIAELNAIFKDLAGMVADQGTALDRIDYNLERVQSSVGAGLRQLQRAHSHHRRDRKMRWIVGLAAALLLLLALLAALKL